MALKDRYKQALINLRPRGRIWEVRPGRLSDKETDIQGEAFAKAQEKIDGIIDETDVRTAEDCLEEWEDIYGLPHDGSLEERRLALLLARQKGLQTVKFYENLCATVGVEVSIKEHCPFMFGDSEAGGDHEIGPEDIVYYWEIAILAGSDEAVAKMKPLVLKHKQSHTVLTFIDMRSENGNN